MYFASCKADLWNSLLQEIIAAEGLEELRKGVVFANSNSVQNYIKQNKCE